jgi:hypothetical protein
MLEFTFKDSVANATAPRMLIGVPIDRYRNNGIDLAAAAMALRGLVGRALDVDWLALDSAGDVAVFLGDDTSPVPSARNAEATSTALEAITRAVAHRFAVVEVERAYRVPAARAQEPIFDAPLAAPNTPLHETWFKGYPHLVVASPTGAEGVRRIMSELGSREVQARDAFAVALDVLGFVSYEELHESGACAGCRVLDDPADPRPRSPEALAAAGLFVYAFASTPQDARADAQTPGGAWLRVASPSVPADRRDVEDMTRMRATVEELTGRFDDLRWMWATWPARWTKK